MSAIFDESDSESYSPEWNCNFKEDIFRLLIQSTFAKQLLIPQPIINIISEYARGFIAFCPYPYCNSNQYHMEIESIDEISENRINYNACDSNDIFVENIDNLPCIVCEECIENSTCKYCGQFTEDFAECSFCDERTYQEPACTNEHFDEHVMADISENW